MKFRAKISLMTIAFFAAFANAVWLVAQDQRNKNP
jgi:hypothetical protein